MPGTPPLVVLSSALIALLADDGPAGTWVARRTAGRRLAAPGLASYEAGNVLRRQVLAGSLDPSAGTLAHRSLLALPVQRWPYVVLANRVWTLRDVLTVYDAAFVALAELLGTHLVTLDRRLAGAPGITCTVGRGVRPGRLTVHGRVSGLRGPQPDERTEPGEGSQPQGYTGEPGARRPGPP